MRCNHNEIAFHNSRPAIRLGARDRVAIRLLPRICAKYTILFFAVAALITLAPAAFAAEVEARLSSEQAYVGVPIYLQVTINNTAQHDEPTLPTVAGLDFALAGTPAVSSQTTIINGRRSHNESVTYAIAITARNPGEYTVPALTVRADGQSLTTPTFRFNAQTSETGDLMFAEIAGTRDAIYVGQPLPLTLRVGIRPFVDTARGVALDEEQMWSRISPDHSNWGVFAGTVQNMMQNGQRPVGKAATRKDDRGENATYFVYEITASAYPNNSGTAEVGDVQIVAAYPTELQETRDFFGRTGLRMAGVRPITASAQAPAITIKPIPTHNRPDDFRGAVGRYGIESRATPTEVNVGDPITLALRIRGDGPMQLLPAPPLSELPALTREFKLPDEPLAGVVQGDGKVFTTTIRPNSTNVTTIPPIPYTFFDPESERFVTVTSEPIPITVNAGKRLDLAKVVSANGNGSTTAFESAESEITSEASRETAPTFYGNMPLDARTLRDTDRVGSAPLLVALLAGPILFLGLVAVRRVRGSVERGASAGMATKRIETAQNAGEIAAAVRSYAIDRFNLPAGATRHDIIGRLREDADASRTIDRLLNECDAASYAPGGSVNLEAMREAARRSVQILENTL